MTATLPAMANSAEGSARSLLKTVFERFGPRQFAVELRDGEQWPPEPGGPAIFKLIFRRLNSGSERGKTPGEEARRPGTLFTPVATKVALGALIKVDTAFTSSQTLNRFSALQASFRWIDDGIGLALDLDRGRGGAES